MAITNITDDFYTLTGNRLSNSSFLRLFNILEDENYNKFMNIFRSYVLNEDMTRNTVFFYTYDVESNDWWDNISNKYYGTPYLWWTICLINNIANPYEDLIEGMQLKILKSDYIYYLIKEIKNISEL